jgi:hypothetical protein
MLGSCSSSSTSAPDGAMADAAPATDAAVVDAVVSETAGGDGAALLDLPPSDLVFGPDSASTSACGATFAKSTANLAAAGSPLMGTCLVDRTDDNIGHGQINYNLTELQAIAARALHVDQFVPDAMAGTAFLAEDGFDFVAQRGVFVSYGETTDLESKLWQADKGLLEIRSIIGKTYTLQLTSVHFVAAPNPMGDNKASGDFELSGTISGTLP